MWIPIQYTNAIFDEDTRTWVSAAEVAEIDSTAFTSKKEVRPGPREALVRRIPDVNAEKKKTPEQDALFDVWRFHSFFTTVDNDVLDTVTADKTHRQHAVIEQTHAGAKNGPLAHMPSGVFNANAAWLVCAIVAFNLLRATGTICGGDHAKATTGTLRRKIITVPARIASSARKLRLSTTLENEAIASDRPHFRALPTLRLHLPTNWSWETAWTTLFERGLSPPTTASS